MSEKLTAEVLSILDTERDMTLASLMADGAPHAVVVSYASKGLSIYFGCSPTSLKARNIARDPRVALTITPSYADWAQIRGLAILGRAVRLQEGEVEAAAQSFLQKFDEMAQFVTTPDEVALCEVIVDRVSLLDYRKGFGNVAYAHRGGAGEAPLVWGGEGRA